MPRSRRQVCNKVRLWSYFQVPLTWTELLKRTARETENDNGVGLAAELAYYFGRKVRAYASASSHLGAAVAAIVAVILLATTVAWGISEELGWPAWEASRSSQC